MTPEVPQGTATAHDARLRLAIAAIILAGLALRLAAAAMPVSAHPDEVFQYLEQAHRLAFGYGTVPWEYRYGIRSWLLPLAISPAMRLGAWLDPSGGLYLFLPKAIAAALSLLIPWSAFRLGQRRSLVHGLVALIVTALWYQFIFFGAHVLTDSLAVSLLMPAAMILTGPAPKRAPLSLAGLLLGVATMLRFQYAPSLAILVIFTCRTDLRRWGWVIGGGIAGLAVSGIVDLAMGQLPFAWIVANVHQNILLGRATRYGVEGPFEYLLMYLEEWGPALIPILFWAARVAKRYQPLVWMGLANLLVHSFIAHKEFRFVLPTTVVLVILAAIGSVDWVQSVSSRWTARRARLAVIGLCAFWTAASAALAMNPLMYRRWWAFSSVYESVQVARAQPGLCGLAFVRMPFWQGGGYTYLHRPVPMYTLDPPVPQTTTAAYNVIIAPRDVPVPAGYRPLSCITGKDGLRPEHGEYPRIVCTYIRAGGCTPAAAAPFEVQTMLNRTDQ